MISGSDSIHSSPKLIIDTTAQSFQHPPPPFTLLDPKPPLSFDFLPNSYTPHTAPLFLSGS